METLTNHRAVVIGATSGIGRETATALVRMGADVAFVGRRVGVLDDAVAAAGRGTAIVADTRNPADCATLIELAVERLGGSLDLIVYAAGASGLATLDRATAEDWRLCFETNVVGPSLVIQAALAHLADRAVVAVLSSESVGMPFPGMGAYASSKAALEESIRVWRVEQPETRFCCVRVGTTTGTDFARDFDPAVAANLLPTWASRGLLPAEQMDPADVGATIAEALGGAVLRKGVDCHEIVLRAPGGLLTGGVDDLVATVADLSSR